MASPAVGTTSDDQNSAAGVTMTEPASSASGHVFHCQVLVEAGFTSFSGPASWTTEYGPIDTGDYTVWLFTIRRGGSAPALTVSWSGAKYYEWQILQITGCVGSGAYVDAKADIPAADRDAIDPPAVTTTTTDTLVVATAAHWAGWFGGSGPSGYTLYDPGVFTDIRAAAKALGAPATEDPGTFSGPGSTDGSWASTIAFRSQAGGAAATSDPIESSGRRHLRQNPIYRMTPGGIYAPVTYSFAP